MPDSVDSKAHPKRRVLFVCLGNICRSPTGEGVFRALVRERGLGDVVEVDSAGTGSWHVGEPADRRMQQTAGDRGYELTSRARQVTPQDFHEFDLIVAMDRSNRENLEAIAPAGGHAELRLFSDFLPPGSPRDVPDPYYGGPQGFERVLDLIEEGSEALLDHLLDGTGRPGRAGG
jgi:protein-tyrosine phosphatase